MNDWLQPEKMQWEKATINHEWDWKKETRRGERMVSHKQKKPDGVVLIKSTMCVCVCVCEARTK